MRTKLLFIPRYHCDPDDYRPINPPFFPPLGIATLKTYLETRGYHVDQDDLDIKTAQVNDKTPGHINMRIFLDQERVDKFFKTCKDEKYEEQAERILKLTSLKGYDVVGFSLMPTDNPSTSSVALALAKVIKEKYDSTIIIGGSVNGEVEYQLLKTKYINCRGRGHPGSSIGETNLLNFLSKHEKGVDFKDIKGINYLDSRGNHVGYDQEYTQEDEFSITKPTFDGLPMDLYRKKKCIEVNGEKKEIKMLVIPYFFIRGCPNACAFCSHSIEQGWAGKDPEIVADELKEYVSKYNTRYFYFHNSTVNPTYRYADALANAFIKKDIGAFWSDCANLSSMDKNLVKKLKESGAVRLVFGFEGASQRVLDYIHKNFTVAHAIKILKLCKKYDIWAELDMICGFPYEYEPDIDKTIRFIHKYKGYIGACSLNKFWLEGRFLKYPHKYGIRTNVEDCETHINWAVRGFDEMNGMPWKERIHHTIKCYEKLQKVITDTFKPAPDIHNLFFDHVKFKKCFGK